MKAILIITLLISTIITSSCSKERKINKRIDGEWKLVSFDGKPQESGVTDIYVFTKDKKNTGTGSWAHSDMNNNIFFNVPFTYTLNNNQITAILNYFNTSETRIFTFTVYEKKKLEYLDSSNKITVLEPK